MFIQIHNRKIHYRQLGSGHPIILLHGWGQNCYSLHQLAKKASESCSVYLIDLPGFGKSDNPPAHWGLEGYAFLIKDFIRQKKLSDPHIYGHGFGSAVAIVLASKEKKLLGQLVLSSSALHRTVKISHSAQMGKQIRHTFPWINPLYPFFKKLYYKLFEKESELADFPALEQNFRRIILQDLTNYLPMITQSVLILWGEGDTCTPVIYGYEMQKKIKNSSIRIVPEANHNLPSTHSSEVWQEMKRFLLS